MAEVPYSFAEAWRNTGLRLEGIYPSEQMAGWQKRHRTRDFWTYIAVLDGQLQLEQGSWSGTLGLGDQAVLLPMHPFLVKTVVGPSRHVTVDFRVLDTLLAANPLPRLGLPAVVHTAVESLAKLNALHQELITHDGHRGETDALDDARGLFDVLLGRYLRTGIESGAIPITAEMIVPDWLTVIRQYVMDHFPDPSLFPAKLAREAGYSTAYFSRTFRRVFGQTPMAFIWETRLKMAARRLEVDPGLTVGDVARQCGFANQSHFTRLFRRQFGMTPTDWRQRQAAAVLRELRSP